MSRFAVDPRWLIYLPPTMSPLRRRRSAPGLLEHPAEAFAVLPPRGRRRSVICEEKHMGSRAVVVVCRDDGVARAPLRRRRRRGSASSTRAPAGRFFDDAGAPRPRCSTRVRAAVDGAGLWDELEHRLARARLRADALVGEGAGAAAAPVRRRRRRRARRRSPRRVATLEQAAARGLERRRRCSTASARRVDARATATSTPTAATAGRSTASTTCALAPFHLLADRGRRVHADRDHLVAPGDAAPARRRSDPELLRAPTAAIVDLDRRRQPRRRRSRGGRS